MSTGTDPGLHLPVRTPRLVVRMMRAGDAAALLAYRNHPEVARFQEWPVPFTPAMAADLIDGQAHLDGPVDGTMVQLAIERDGTIVGDLAVGLHDDGRQATLGYSIAPDHQGKGYATEAARAVVLALFEQANVHRVSASIDPANIASRRVLAKLGFRHEGCALRSVRVRGEWVDDDRFALLADEVARDPSATLGQDEVGR